MPDYDAPNVPRGEERGDYRGGWPARSMPGDGGDRAGRAVTPPDADRW